MKRNPEDESVARRTFFKYALGQGLAATPGGALLSAGIVIFAGKLLTGCGGSGGGGGGGGTAPVNSNNATSTTVSAAIEAKVGSGNVQRKPTSHGNKIIHVNNSGSVVQGEDIVYTVNGIRIDSVKPESQSVKTGDVIDLFDLINGSRTAIIVS